jgi:hypothetical protein
MGDDRQSAWQIGVASQLVRRRWCTGDLALMQDNLAQQTDKVTNNIFRLATNTLPQITASPGDSYTYEFPRDVLVNWHMARASLFWDTR